MVRLTPVALAIALTLLTCGRVYGQVRHYPLETADGLRLHNVAAEPAVLDGKKGLRVTLSDETLRRFKGMTDDEVNDAQARVGQYAVIEGLEFSDGVITAEVAGAPAPGADSAARGFVGIAFRLRDGAYDLFSLRLTNGRAEEQERRNHATQYASHPDWPWFRLRKETPSRYESYVDLLPDVWTTIRIDVRGDRARLYVHGQEQPTLIINDLKSGVQRTGKVALWVNYGTIAHFRNLTVTADVHGAARPDAGRPDSRKPCSKRWMIHSTTASLSSNSSRIRRCLSAQGRRRSFFDPAHARESSASLSATPEISTVRWLCICG